MNRWIALIVTAAFALGGCNTVDGIGKDIEAGGEKVQDAAADVKKEM